MIFDAQEENFFPNHETIEGYEWRMPLRKLK